ncbi:hypothetical protein DM860_012356 [Cuscuta australis]|uniref:Uncharacterized protein n=1 Tax=Cuscuta australis TaxID=267555 RepID=A0A328DUD9_9ASTE|nr:hypothetical protein DM860_012356 [Cuscuta australis]
MLMFKSLPSDTEQDIFVSPSQISKQRRLAGIAGSTLQPESEGKSRIRAAVPDQILEKRAAPGGGRWTFRKGLETQLKFSAGKGHLLALSSCC